MKLYPEQLIAHLQKTIVPCYLVAGDVPLLNQETCQHIRHAAKNNGYLEKKIFQVEKSFDWQQWLSQAYARSLFSDKTLFELRINSGKLLEATRKALSQWLEKPPADKILLLVMSKLEATEQNCKWFKTFEKNGIVVAVYPLDMMQFSRWLSQRLQQTELKTDTTGLQLLMERTEGNLLAAQQAIEKLQLLYGKGQLTAQQIADAIADSARFNVFQLLDYALAGNNKRVIRIITGLQQEGNEVTIVLWAIARELRTLATMALAVKQGQALPQVLQQYHVWEKRKPLIRTVLQRHRYENFLTLLQHAAKIDRLAKGAEMGNVWNELSSLLLSLTDFKIHILSKLTD